MGSGLVGRGPALRCGVRRQDRQFRRWWRWWGCGARQRNAGLRDGSSHEQSVPEHGPGSLSGRDLAGGHVAQRKRHRRLHQRRQRTDRDVAVGLRLSVGRRGDRADADRHAQQLPELLADDDRGRKQLRAELHRRVRQERLSPSAHERRGDALLQFLPKRPRLRHLPGRDGGGGAGVLAVAVLRLPAGRRAKYVARADRRPLGAYEVASRLSYFLNNSMPDSTLMAAADANLLQTADEVEAQARRLLMGDRARADAATFNSQWLNMVKMEGLTKDATAFPSMTPQIAQALHDSTVQFADYAFWIQDSLAAMLTDTHAFVNDS